MNIQKSIILCVILLSARLCYAQNLVSFEGEVDFADNQFDIVLYFDDESSMAAKAQRASPKDYRLSLDIDHLKTPFFDLLSKIEGSVEVVRDETDSPEGPDRTMLKGKIWSQYSLVDYKPIQELSGNFSIRDKRLHITALSVGEMKCSGTIDLQPPYKLNLTINLFDMSMQDFLAVWGVGEKYDSSGAVSGEIKVSGTPDNLALKGSLQSRDGFVAKLDYDVISLNIEGIYPNMKIARSMIAKSDGVSFTLDGPINLKDKENFKKQIRALTLAPLTSDTGLEREWTIKRLDPDGSQTTELKYRFRKGDALSTGTSVDDEIDMLGVEQTRKF